jgi:carbon monoxide dehydrogenase subunit G
VKVGRSRTLEATPAEVWAIVGDPGQLWRWWPRVDRVESVDAAGFTEVYKTKKNRTVRADFRIAALEQEREIRVVQQLEGTPFERIFAKSGKRCLVEPAGAGTRLTVELTQTPAGLARLGGLMVRKAMRRQLDTGLDALTELL